MPDASTRSFRRAGVFLALVATAWFLFIAPGVSLATTDASSPDDPVETLRQQLLELQRQMLEIERRHTEEIEALKKEIQVLRGNSAAVAVPEEDELAALLRLAELEAAKAEQSTTEEQEDAFTAKGLSLQALNPEFSVTGDFLASYRHQKGTRQHTDFNFRSLGLHFESYLDPYTRFKAAVPVTTSGAELGEAYITRYALLNGLNLTFGKFRQQFGVINRWHKHALDQTDFPLALRQIFGEGGLNQTGLSFDWVLPPLWGASQDLTFQLTNGKNARLFSGNTLGTPSVLLHYKNYHELSKNTYAEFGLSGIVGWKDQWTIYRNGSPDTLNGSLPTRVFGLDFNLLWEPTDRMRYRNVEWRTEFYFLDRDIMAPDGSGEDTIVAWGAFTYLQCKLNRKLDLGIRLDYYQPDQKDYADLGGFLAPHAFTDDVHFWQVTPYATYQQSPFVRYRLEYSHLERRGLEKPEDSLIFQLIFAAGPHKHDRY